jgi:hypothetical protein
MDRRSYATFFHQAETSRTPHNEPENFAAWGGGHSWRERDYRKAELHPANGTVAKLRAAPHANCDAARQLPRLTKALE